MSENHEELLDLIDIYAIHDLQGDDLDFGFVDLAPSSSQTVLATTGIYQESPLTCPSVDSVMSSPDMDDSGFVSETDEDVDHQSIPAETVLPCQETRRGRKRRRCAPASIEHITVYKRRKIRVSDDRDL
ncbi:uncharacterized protein LOC135469401 [Liolophura sinensis]|uniref:uncharacterized protein LOC135469401 n=1 Tax=Liolophura sinensis TaxID=3198878 RepID=UPI0031593635